MSMKVLYELMLMLMLMLYDELKKKDVVVEKLALEVAKMKEVLVQCHFDVPL